MPLFHAQLVKTHSHLLLNPKAYYSIHNSPTLVPVLSETNAVFFHTLLLYELVVHFPSIHI
jgi:hypothetical protein